MTNLSDINRRNGHPAWLNQPAAESYERMKRDGMPGNCVSDAGRTNAEQWHMWNLYKAGKLPATAAYPGTSKHETGNALDLAEPARAWVRANGEKYGFLKDLVRNEPWHFEYRAEHDTRPPAPATPKPEPVPEPEPILPKGDKMYVLKNTSTNKYYAASHGFLRHLTNTDQVKAALKAYGQEKSHQLSEGEFGTALNTLGIPRAVAKQINGGKQYDPVGTAAVAAALPSLFRSYLGRDATQKELDERILHSAINGTSLETHRVQIASSKEAKEYAARK